MDTPTPDKDILRKIAGLLRLADKNSNVHESAAAAGAAQALLTKHRLTEADLGDATEAATETVGIAEEPIETMSQRSAWRVNLAVRAARVNGCRIFTRRDLGGVHIKVIGRPSDTKIVTYFVRYLTGEIDRLATRAVSLGEIHGKTQINNFRIGAVQAVTERLARAQAEERRSAQEAARAQGTTSTAIVRLDQNDAAVQKYVDGMKLRAAPRSNWTMSQSAFEKGQQAGSRISLNKGIEGATGHKSLDYDPFHGVPRRSQRTR